MIRMRVLPEMVECQMAIGDLNGAVASLEQMVQQKPSQRDCDLLRELLKKQGKPEKFQLFTVCKNW